MLNNGSDRTTLKEDAKYLNELLKDMDVKVPIITAVTRVDSLEPAREKVVAKYSERKKSNIREKKRQVTTVLREAGIKDPVVIPVSAYVEWSHHAPETLNEKEQKELTIEFDGRYNINGLIEHLEESMDFRAALDMMMNDRIDNAIKKIAQKLVKSFSSVSAGVATTPIPAGDIFVLVPIQIIEVTLIAQLNGIKLDKEAARDFVLSLGGIALVGLGLRFAAQQGAKFLNLVIVGAGSAMSAGIAYAGTYAIGQAAIMYYLEGKTKEEINEEINKGETEDEMKVITHNEKVDNDEQIKTQQFLSRFTNIKSDEDAKQEAEENKVKEEKHSEDKENENKNFFVNTQDKVKGFFKGFGNKEDEE